MQMILDKALRMTVTLSVFKDWSQRWNYRVVFTHKLLDFYSLAHTQCDVSVPGAISGEHQI